MKVTEKAILCETGNLAITRKIMNRLIPVGSKVLHECNSETCPLESSGESYVEDVFWAMLKSLVDLNENVILIDEYQKEVKR